MAKQLEEHAAAQVKLAKEALIDLAPLGGKGNKVNLSRVISPGRVNYKKALESNLPDLDLEPYKGEPSESFRITIEKEKRS